MNKERILPSSLGLLIFSMISEVSEAEKLVGSILMASIKLYDLTQRSEAEEEGVILRSGLGLKPITWTFDPGFEAL